MCVAVRRQCVPQFAPEGTPSPPSPPARSQFGPMTMDPWICLLACLPVLAVAVSWVGVAVSWVGVAVSWVGIAGAWVEIASARL